MSLGFVFPGQGAQEVGMLAALAAQHGTVRATFAEAADALQQDLWRLVQEGPEVELNRTANTQPAVLVASVAVWRTWQSLGGAAAKLTAGHSLGEYTALVVAGSMTFSDAVRAVRKRGELMQAAVPEGQGAVAAILGIDDDVVLKCCAEAGGSVSPANFNSPGQLVIAGESAAVDRAVDACKRAGAKRAMRLPLSVPVHCDLMRGAANEFAGFIADLPIQASNIPVIHNVDAATATGPAEIRRKLIEQVYLPVQWTRCVEALAKGGATHLVELGPGRVLNGLIRRIDKSIQTESANDPDSLSAALKFAATVA